MTSCNVHKAPKIVEESILNSWGYETTCFEAEKQTKWAKGKYGAAQIIAQAIQSRQLKDGYRPRYTLWRETYEYRHQAENRLSKIQERDMSLPDEYEKALVWNTGFVDGTSVIYVSTDADVFGYNAIKALKAKIEHQHTKK